MLLRLNHRKAQTRSGQMFCAMGLTKKTSTGTAVSMSQCNLVGHTITIDAVQDGRGILSAWGSLFSARVTEQETEREGSSRSHDAQPFEPFVFEDRTGCPFDFWANKPTRSFLLSAQRKLQVDGSPIKPMYTAPLHKTNGASAK